MDLRFPKEYDEFECIFKYHDFGRLCKYKRALDIAIADDRDIGKVVTQVSLDDSCDKEHIFSRFFAVYILNNYLDECRDPAHPLYQALIKDQDYAWITEPWKDLDHTTFLVFWLFEYADYDEHTIYPAVVIIALIAHDFDKFDAREVMVWLGRRPYVIYELIKDEDNRHTYRNISDNWLIHAVVFMYNYKDKFDMINAGFTEICDPYLLCVCKTILKQKNLPPELCRLVADFVFCIESEDDI